MQDSVEKGWSEGREKRWIHPSLPLYSLQNSILCSVFFGLTKVLTTSSGKDLISLSLSFPPPSPLRTPSAFTSFISFTTSLPRCYASLHIFPADDISFLFFTSLLLLLLLLHPSASFSIYHVVLIFELLHLLGKLQAFLVQGQCLARKKSDIHFTSYGSVEEERFGSLDSLLHFIVLPLTGKLVFIT